MRSAEIIDVKHIIENKGAHSPGPTISSRRIAPLRREAGLAALHWLEKDYRYEITGADLWAAYSNTIKAPERLDRRGEVRDRARAMVDKKGFVAQVLGRELALTAL
ncbi:MAG: hypothetical protein JO166_16280 [Deltaproteobacteria bacterium]|nr:hypothetical protein [Deltaproteobacteria bacterium]